MQNDKIKNYSYYQKSEEVYFSGEFAFPLILILIATLISYGILFFLGISIMVLFNVFISWCSYFYLYYYGKSYSNITLNFLKGVFLITCLLLFVDYGIYVLVVYQKTRLFNKFCFQLWIVILVGIPTVYYGFQYGRYYFFEWRMAINYLKVSLEIHHDSELITHFDTIQFVNTSKFRSTDIKLGKTSCFHSEEELKKRENNSMLNYYYEKSVFSGIVHLPFRSNSLLMSWYSIIEDKYYDVELLFPFEKMIIEQEKYPTNVPVFLRGKKTKRLNLHIHTNGGIRLFNSDTVLINHPNSVPSTISIEERNVKIEQYSNSHEYYNDPKAFSDLIEKIKASSGIEERFQIQNKLILWSMNISGLEGENYLDVFDVSFSKYKSEIAEMKEVTLRFLPKKIELIYRGYHLYRWLVLRINTQRLFQVIQKLTDFNEDNYVSLGLVFENSSKKADLKFIISGNGKSMVFTDWEIQIDKERKQSMEDHLLKKNEEEQKRTLLKEAWGFVGNKQYNLAQEKCETILALDPKFGYAYFLECRLMCYKEGFEACYAKRDYFISKTMHEPRALAHIYNNYGCLLDQELRYDEAVLYFQKAMESYPKEGLYVCNLAEIYCKLKDSKKAMEFAKKSKKLGHESETLRTILESKGAHDFVKMSVD